MLLLLSAMHAICCQFPYQLKHISSSLPLRASRDMALSKASSADVAGWTETDHYECLRLMRKAQSFGVLQPLVETVYGESDWSLISGCPGEGSMNDASKRLRSEDEATERVNAPPKMVMSGPPCQSYSNVKGYKTVPPSVTEVGTDVGTLPNLPPGVPTLKDWGRTKVSFGKFMNKRTYLSLHQSNTEEDRSYKKWLSAHFANGSAHLKDLVNYLMAMGDSMVVDCKDGSQTVLIPGTDVPRVLN